MKTYRVYFTDTKDGCPNQKLLMGNPNDICTYMASLGHTNIIIEEVISC